MLRIPIVGAALAGRHTAGASRDRCVHVCSFARADFDPAAIGAIETDVFEMALGAATCAVRTGAVKDPGTLTVIDYSKPSSERRLWVFDLQITRVGL